MPSQQADPSVAALPAGERAPWPLGPLSAGWPYLVLVGAAILLRGQTLSNHILSVDEPSYFAQAARLPSLEAFVYAFYYRVEIKTQIGLIPYLIAARLDSHNATWLIHLFGVLVVVLSGYLMMAFTRRFLHSPLPGLVAALAWFLFLEIGPGYYPAGLDLTPYFPAPKLEYFQTPLILASLYGVAWGGGAGARPRHAGWVTFGAGFAWAVAVLIKPGAILLGPVYLAALFAFAGRAAWRATLRSGGAFILGAGLPVVAVFAPYLLNPAALAELRFNLVDLNSSYLPGESILVRSLALLVGVPPMLLGLYLLAPPLVRARLRERIPNLAGRALALALVSAPAVFIGYLPGRAYPYYLVPIVPLLALTVAGYLALAGQALVRRGQARRAVALGVLLGALYILPQLPVLVQYTATAGEDTYLADDQRRFDLQGLVAYIQAHSRPTDLIWVYYNTPEVYGLSERRPATRDPVGVWLAFIWNETWFRRTAAELQAEQPTLIVGIDQPRFPQPRAQPLLAIPQAGDRISSTYQCDPAAVRGTLICTRK